MRRFWISLALLLLILGLGAAGNSSLNRLTQQLSGHVQQTDALVRQQKTDAALQTLNHSYGVWRSHQTLLGAILHHDEINKIDISYLRAIQYIRQQNHADYFVESAELGDLLQQLSDFTECRAGTLF